MIIELVVHTLITIVAVIGTAILVSKKDPVIERLKETAQQVLDDMTPSGKAEVLAVPTREEADEWERKNTEHGSFLQSVLDKVWKPTPPNTP